VQSVAAGIALAAAGDDNVCMVLTRWATLEILNTTLIEAERGVNSAIITFDQVSHANVIPYLDIGSCVIRLPVAAYIAFARAGPAGGRPGTQAIPD